MENYDLFVDIVKHLENIYLEDAEGNTYRKLCKKSINILTNTLPNIKQTPLAELQ